MTGWVNRRSTRTTTVLSCLSLTTTPCSMRFGISLLLRLGSGAGASRLSGTLLGGNGLDTGDITTDLAHACSVLELAGCPLEAQVEALLCKLENLVLELVQGHCTQVARFHAPLLKLLCDALDEPRLDRQLGSRKAKRLARECLAHPINLE